ncbi:MAG: hypothetical protein ISR34_11690 [Pirellulales bacterium]|nr:hypothetical protein [Pirellulales bacterium]
MATELATQKGWYATREAALTVGRDMNQVFLLTPLLARQFINQLDTADIAGWRFLDHFSYLKFIVYEERDCQWVTGIYDKHQRVLYIETAMGEVTHRLYSTMWKWVTLTRPNDTSEWKCLVSASEICSSPCNAAIFTWASLWSENQEDRPTGEEAHVWRWRAYCYAGYALVAPIHTERLHYGTMTWREMRAGRNQAAKKHKAGKSQSKIPWRRVNKDRAPDIPGGLEGEIPVLPCPEHKFAPAEGGEWCPHRLPPARSSRILSQNVGPVGLKNTIPTIQRSIRAHQPSVVLLQDCRVKSDDLGTIAELRAAFPQYLLFVRSGHHQEKRRLRVSTHGRPRHYCFSVVTLIHMGCGKASEYRPEETAASKHCGRLLTICVEPTNQPPFVVTNVYNYTSGERHYQRDFMQQLTVRMRDVTDKPHILAGDFNASLLGSSRRGYTSNPRCQEADQLFVDFVLNPDLYDKWWTGRITEGVWTRRNPSKVQWGRIDEVLIQGYKASRLDVRERELAGSHYQMHTVDHGDSRLDHFTLIADIPISVLPKCRHRIPRTQIEIPDVSAWEANQDEWREATLRHYVPPTSSDPYAILDAWIRAASFQAPKKSRTVGGSVHPRPPHCSAKSQKLNKQIKLLERELDTAPSVQSPLQVTYSMRKIHGWKGDDDIKQIDLPVAASPDASWMKWRTDLQNGIKERRQCLKRILRQEQKDLVSDIRSRCRARMERPREKEIQRLLGKRTAKAPSDNRSSKIKQKRHPDKIGARLSDDKWKSWITLVAGADLWSCVERLRARSLDESCDERVQCWQGRNMTIEVTVGSATEMQLRVSPMDKITAFMECCPAMSAGEYIQVSSSEAQKLKHDTDTMCHEECFFATNALSAQTYCPCCSSSRKPVPVAKVISGGQRELRYVCECGTIRSSFPTKPLKQCPVPDDLLRAHGFQSTEPILTAFLERDDFDAWLRKRPAGTSPGEDTISYEMWQASPEPMKDALYQAVLQAVTSGHIPQAWESSLVKLLVKREGEEHILESLRPICLMATAAKLTTGIWAHRMSTASEQDGVNEGSQEGFRPDRSAKRQVARFLSCIQSCKQRQTKLIVAFLDFENYFNTISLPALFLILRKLGMPEADVKALECYYASSCMQIAHADGAKSARISLGRGLRQGCPLSPILGGIVVNAMLRWLEHQGGGIQHPSGVETNVLAFADDATLLTEQTDHMARLMQCVHEFCEWAGVQINMGKSEVTGYDFRRNRPITTHGLRIGGQSPKHILPSTPFKYLGIRLNILGEMAAEREYVISKTRALSSMLKGHQYHPRQIHVVVQTAIVPVFRYSAALAQWNLSDQERLWHEWCRAYKYAWKLKPATSLGFFHTSAWGGLDAGTPAEILTKEVAGLMEQCYAVQSDLGDMLKMDMCQLVRNMGSSSVEDLQRRLAEVSPIPPPDTLCYSFLSTMGSNARVSWPSITVEDRVDDCRSRSRGICAEIAAPGVLTLLDDMKDTLTEREWELVTRLLFSVASLGFHRLASVLQDAVLQLPGVVQPTQATNAALGKLVTRKGLTLEWIGPEQRNTALKDLLACIRPGDVGASLIESRICVRRGKTHSWGTIRSYCEESRMYTAHMQDQSVRVLDHNQVTTHWVPSMYQSTWTRNDQMSMGACVKKILGSKRTRQTCQLRTPHATLLASKQWTSESVWFLCTISYGLPQSIDAMLARTWSLDADRQAAQKLCDDQVVFWAPKDVWNWQSTSHSNKAGWIVQACGMIERPRGIVLVVRSLHQDEQHREGEIWMTSDAGPSLRRLHAAHKQRTQSPMVYLSAAEVGVLDEGGYVPCTALRQYQQQQPVLAAPEGPVIRYPPIVRRPYAPDLVIPQVKFGMDMTALKPWDMSFVWKGETTRITVHHGQAFIGSKPRKSVGKSLKCGGARRARIRGSYHIDAGRLAILRKWHGHEDMVSIWKSEWDRLGAWEEAGGRTLHWAITTNLRQQYTLKNAVYVHSLATDPSFDCHLTEHDTPRVGRTYLPLYEMSPERAVQLLCRYEQHAWVAIVRADTKSPLTPKLRQLGCAGERMDKGSRVKLKKGWWRTGEQMLIKSDGTYEVWHSKTVATPEPSDPLHTMLHWMPSAEPSPQSESLSTYLQALPGAKYWKEGLVVATDGSLRTRKDSSKEFSMGAGVAGTGREPLRMSLRVGGQYSSTRAELVAIAAALRVTHTHPAVAFLVDSSAALQRMTWFRSKDFRPSPRKVKDLDVLMDIVASLSQRQENGLSTTFVKVHGHSGDPLHAIADYLAVQGADQDDEEAEFVAGRPDCILYSWAQDGSERTCPWGPQIKRRIRQVTGEQAWAEYAGTGVVDAFLGRRDAGRALLGSALRSTWDWAVRGWMLGVSPYSYPTRANISKWRKHGSAHCECGHGDETFAHMQLNCNLARRRSARQQAHNKIASLVEKYSDMIRPKDRISVWDKQVGTFIRALESARPDGIILNEVTIRNLTRWKMAVSRGKADARQAGHKRSLTDVHSLFAPAELRKRPDGLIFDLQHRTIYLVEIARTGDAEGSLRNRYLQKTLKYLPTVEALRVAFSPCRVEQVTLVIGVLGSIAEHTWRHSLTVLGMSRGQQDKLILKCMRATIEGTHSVLLAEENATLPAAAT